MWWWHPRLTTTSKIAGEEEGEGVGGKENEGWEKIRLERKGRRGGMNRDGGGSKGGGSRYTICSE